MRIEVIKCDICKKEHDAQYELPTDWIVTIQTTAYSPEDHHFCSKECLITWAEKEYK